MPIPFNIAFILLWTSCVAGAPRVACAGLGSGQGLGGARRGGDHITNCLLAFLSLYEGLAHLLKHSLPSWWLILREAMIASFQQPWTANAQADCQMPAPALFTTLTLMQTRLRQSSSRILQYVQQIVEFFNSISFILLMRLFQIWHKFLIGTFQKFSITNPIDTVCPWNGAPNHFVAR